MHFCFACQFLREAEITAIQKETEAKWTAALREQELEQNRAKKLARWPNPACDICGSRKHTSASHKAKQIRIAKANEKRKALHNRGIAEDRRSTSSYGESQISKGTSDPAEIGATSESAEHSGS
jgi:hypothetical protein